MYHKKFLFFFFLILLAIVPMSSSAQIGTAPNTLPGPAADYTINVPVSVQSLSASVEKVIVSCFLSKTSRSSSPGLGSNTVIVPISSVNSYVGSVAVGINIANNVNRNDVKYYSCDLKLQTANSQPTSPLPFCNNSTNPTNWRCKKPGSAFNIEFTEAF